LESNCLENLINTRDNVNQSVEEEGHTLSICSVSNSTTSNVKGGLLKINKNLSLVPYLLSSGSRKGGWVTDLQMKSNLPFTSAENEVRTQLLQI
jgi:glycine cleavage system H lipoate-binding protein